MKKEYQEIIKPNKNYRPSLSYQMVMELINNKGTPLYIRFKLYFGVLQRYHDDLFMLNDYLAEKFEVSLFKVKYHLKKLKDDGSILIENPGSFKRRIRLLEYIIITDEELTEEMRQKQEDLKQSAFGKTRIKDNVYLTEIELEELKELMGIEYVQYINNLNKYIEEKKVHYVSHYETLKAWWYKNQKAKKQKKKQEETPDFLPEEYIEEESTTEDTWLGEDIADLLKEYQDYLDS